MKNRGVKISLGGRAGRNRSEKGLEKAKEKGMVNGTHKQTHTHEYLLSVLSHSMNSEPRATVSFRVPSHP